MASSYACTLFILKFLLLTLSASSSDDFVETLNVARTEKNSLLHLYFQDRPSGKNPTSMQIIVGKGFGLGFKAMYMIDDALTRSADRGSEIIGRAQGIYLVATQNDLGLLMVVYFYFSQGKYNGSSLSMLGRNGSGLFRFVRGYAMAHTVWVDAKTGDATVQYNVSVNHF